MAPRLFVFSCHIHTNYLNAKHTEFLVHTIYGSTLPAVNSVVATVAPKSSSVNQMGQALI